MDKAEFRLWLHNYRKRFANVNKLFRECPALGDDWFKALGRHTRQELEDAQFEIVTAEKSPYAGEHLGKLLAILKSKAPSSSWSPPAPEQYSYSAREDAEIEDMINAIVSPRLQNACRRVLKMQHYEAASPFDVPKAPF